MQCPKCKSWDIKKDGFRQLASGKKQRYQCLSCEYRFSDGNISEFDNPKLLYFDIETAPMKAWVWHTGKNYIRPEDVEQDWFVISWAAKWVCDNVVFSDVLTPEEALNQDDKRICKRMWELFDTADVVLGHNSRKFDVRRMNWRFIIHKFSPPSPYKIIDTLTESRKISAASSHKLDQLAKKTGINGGKTDTDFGLWKECVRGNGDALKKMVEYNEHDILIGEEWYFVIRPWMKAHPNMGLYYDTNELRCRNCGNTDVKISNKPYHTPANSYKSWRCGECGAVGRTNTAVIDIEKRRSLMK